MYLQLGRETRIVISAAAAPPVVRAARYLQTEVERRTGLRWEVAGGEAGPGDIVLGIKGDGAPPSPLPPERAEEIALWSDETDGRPEVYAVAGGPSVALAAAGRLARLLDLSPGHAALPLLYMRERPSYPVRGHTYANHKQNNTHDKWDFAQWEEYLTEMAAWGDNIAILYPLHPGRWQGVLPFEEGPWFDTPAREREYYRQLEIQLRLPALCHELGMRYGLWLPVNDVFPEEARRHPEITRYGRAFVCPSIPEARRRIRAFRDHLFSMLPHLDVLFLPSKDDGSCPGCEHCTPWGPVYLELVREQAAQARRCHPDCKVWVAQQGLSGAETRGLVDWLERERPDWVEGVAFGPYSELMTFGDGAAADPAFSLGDHSRGGPVSAPVNRLRAAVPGQYRVLLYPDETHVFNCQYPIIGMDPAVQYIWGREDGISVRPREMADKHAQTAPASDGAIPYTEGNTDDVNKIVWSARGWNGGLSAEAISAEYARWFFGHECTGDACDLILLLEEILNGPIYAGPQVDEARALVERCEAVSPALLDNWRWLNLRLGALMLAHIQQVMRRDRRVIAQLRYRVAVWHAWLDPAPGLRETISYLESEFASTEALLREIVWTRDKLFTQQKLAVRGVAKLQNSYQRLDVLLERWRAVLARLEQGELSDFPERYDALVNPLVKAENTYKTAMQGVGLVGHLREFEWEQGATTWSWA